MFLARLLLWFMDEQKQTRKQAEANAAKAIWGLIDADAGTIEQISHDFDIGWFRVLVRECEDRDLIVSTMNQKNMKEAALREPAAMSAA